MLRMTVFASLVLAVCCLLASLVFVLPAVLAARAELPGTPRLMMFLPLLSACFGVLTGVLGLTASPAPAEAPYPAEQASHGHASHSGDEHSSQSVAGLQAAMQQLYTLLTEERAEVGAWREVCSKGTAEATSLTERLAGLADDLENRLSAGMAQVENALRNPASAATRAAEATLRVERALARTETALRALPEASTAATNAAASLRQEAAGLIAAAQQVSSSQTGAAATGADRLPPVDPQYLADMTGLASRLTTTLETAAESLKDGRQALDTAGQGVLQAGEKAATRLTAVAEVTLQQLAEVVKDANAPRPFAGDPASAPPDLSELTQITETLKTTATQLTEGTQTLTYTGKTAAERVALLAEQSLAKLAGAATDLVSRPSPGAAMGAASHELSRPDLSQLTSITATLQTAADRIVDGSRELQAAGDQAAASGKTAAEKLAELVDRSMGRLAAAADTVAQLAQAPSTTHPGPGTPMASAPDLSGLAGLNQNLKASAEILAKETQSLNEAGRKFAASSQSAAERLASAAGGLQTEAAALNVNTQQIAQAGSDAAQALTAAAQGLAAAGQAASGGIAGAATELQSQAAVLVGAGQHIANVSTQAAQGITTAGEATAERIATATAGLQRQTAALTGTTQHITKVGADTAQLINEAANRMEEAATGAQNSTASLADTTRRIDEASEAAARTVRQSAEQAAQALASAAGNLGGTTMSATQDLVEAGRGLQRATETLQVVGREIATAGRQAADSFAATASGERPAIELPDISGLAALTTTLSAATITLSDGMSALDEAARRVAASGEAVAERLAAAHVPAGANDPILQRLPEISAAIAAASAGLQHEAAVIAATAQQITAQLAARPDQGGPAGDILAGDILAGAANRAEATAEGLEQAGRLIAQAAEEVSVQIGRLAGIAAHAETQAAVLPGITAQIAETTGLLREAADGRRTAVPYQDDRLDALSARLEKALSAMPAAAPPETTLAPALHTLAQLSADIDGAVHRVEAALAHHDGAGEAFAAAMAQVQATIAAVMNTAERNAPDGGPATTPVGATLTHLNAVSSETEKLLAQTEALAEAVVAGRAPDLSGQLANRAPAVLAEIEATIRRLQSVATAVALASDGPPHAERRAV